MRGAIARRPVHGRSQVLFADKRDRIHGDALAPDVVPICLADSPDRHLTHLGTAADDDDALAVDGHQRLRLFDALDDREPAEPLDQRGEVIGRFDFEQQRRPFPARAERFDRLDVGGMRGDGASDLGEHARGVVRLDDECFCRDLHRSGRTGSDRCRPTASGQGAGPDVLLVFGWSRGG